MRTAWGTTSPVVRREFRKTRNDLVSTVIEDEDSANRVNGERTQGLGEHLGLGSEDGDETTYGDDLGYGDDYGVPDPPVTDFDAMAILREAGLDPTAPDAGGG